ncbi:choice-of-anchor Q domain-containing protein, partial [Candidatus Hydrogenedentota bacterium]
MKHFCERKIAVRTQLALISIIFLCFIASSIAHGAVLRVDPRATGAANGTTWTDAYTTIQAAVDVFGGNDIWIAAGTYTSVTDPVVSLGGNDNLYGGFLGLAPGGGEVILSQRDWERNLTIIDGENARRCVNASNPLGLDGLVIRRGYSTLGGGLYVVDSFPADILNCTFENNTAYEATTVGGNGGAAYLTAISGSVSSCIFRNNSADGALAGSGGAVHLSSSTVAFANCILDDNDAKTSGGGVYVSAGVAASMANCVFFTNSAGDGGSLYDEEGSGILNSVFWNGSPNEITGVSTTVSNSVVQGGFTGTAIIDGDPMFIEPFRGNFRLKYDSPCIDAGDVGESVTAPTTDIDGNSRPFDVPGTGADSTGSEYDIGVYEMRRVIYVDDSASGTGDGTSWTNADTTIQGAVDASSSGDDIWVADGTYTSVSDPVVTMKGSVDIFGGFAGNETYQEEKDKYGGSLVLSTIIDGENSRRCVITANDTTLEGFTITNGRADFGAGMTSSVESSMTVTNCRFEGNSATNSGGGAYNNGSEPTFNSCEFVNNNAAVNGAGACNSSGAPSFTNCYFQDNVANGVGGAIDNRSSTSTDVTNCVFWNNSAIDGGALYAADTSSMTIINTTFFGNTASTSGGAVFTTAATTSVTNSILWGDSPDELYPSTGLRGAGDSDIQGGYPDGTNILNIDPEFIDSSRGDFHLSNTSPCLDVGASISGVPNFDIENQRRPVDIPLQLPDSTGTEFDLGAYEMHRTIYVDVDSRATTPTGFSWADAFTTIADGASEALPGDEVWVAEGIYTGIEVEVVSMAKDIAIFGGFAANETKRIQRDWNLHRTIVDGENLRRCLHGADGGV